MELTLGPDTFQLKAGDAVTLLRGELRRSSNAGSRTSRILIVSAT